MEDLCKQVFFIKLAQWKAQNFNLKRKRCSGQQLMSLQSTARASLSKINGYFACIRKQVLKWQPVSLK